jgi:hypothetical protein
LPRRYYKRLCNHVTTAMRGAACSRSRHRHQRWPDPAIGGEYRVDYHTQTNVPVGIYHTITASHMVDIRTAA